MTEKNKHELEELKSYVKFPEYNKIRVNRCKKGKVFPIDELKAWLREDTKRHEMSVVLKSQGKNCFDNIADKHLTLSQIIQIIRLVFDTVGDKIAELEGSDGT